MSPQTRRNLLKAKLGWAFASAKSGLIAQQARQNRRADFAMLFVKTARIESLEHFDTVTAAEPGRDELGYRDAFTMALRKVEAITLKGGLTMAAKELPSAILN